MKNFKPVREKSGIETNGNVSYINLKRIVNRIILCYIININIEKFAKVQFYVY